jgi:hypothetical protein
MDITQKIEAVTSVLVRMDEAGKVSARMVGYMPYATVKEATKPRDGDDETSAGDGAGKIAKAVHVPHVSADVEFTKEECAEIGEILAMIAEKHMEGLAARLGDARAEARRTAKFMGELI